MTRWQGNSIKERVNQTVLVEHPHPHSAASLVLISREYYIQDKSIYNDTRMSRIKNHWFKQLMEHPDERGGLTCAICGRKGLLPESRRKNKATLDHIVNISENGSWNDPLNFQVACRKCNIDKNNVAYRKSDWQKRKNELQKNTTQSSN